MLPDHKGGNLHAGAAALSGQEGVEEHHTGEQSAGDKGSGQLQGEEERLPLAANQVDHHENAQSRHQHLKEAGLGIDAEHNRNGV